MEIPTLLILLCCSYYGYAAHHVQTIPIEHYETELQDLGQHVDVHETPVRVVKITKTVAVKIPVPYPVKVIEKVPYPVHINKPYPVQVPQIVKIPHVKSPPKLHEHEALGGQDGSLKIHRASGQHDEYQVQEIQSDTPVHGDSYEPEVQSFNGYDGGHSQGAGPYNDYSSEGSSGNSYQGPTHGYYGSAGGDDADTKSYDEAIQDYLHKINAGGSNHGASSFNYH
ncbi:unnamed protein product [Chrysodeixis includens]|uniref:Uncharacterized protein n=1 Tax=Chrysodeixis includens TaxID=689277 RepID=A0A9N8L1J6_CHRIL|nr:unnamed protein product [Chrysodeixis includens]